MVKAGVETQNYMFLEHDFLTIIKQKLDETKSPYKNKGITQINLSDYLPYMQKGLIDLKGNILTPREGEQWTKSQISIVAQVFTNLETEINRYRRVNLNGWPPVKVVIDVQ
ncbi:hypothetical protein EBR66_04640 [bacterium]|nr:hypothetical protein [bacterium]